MQDQEEASPSILLRYLPEYKVVVCTQCQYAIQPNAISRHLKEIHEIKRGRRKPYMRYVSQLRLDPADSVLEAPIERFPVKALPVVAGWQCAHESCEHLCASTKRMQKHWVEEHGRHGHDTTDWRPVPLQTFFKGNLLRYFTGTPILFDINSADSKLDISKKWIETATLENAGAVLSPADTELLRHYVRSTYRSLVTADEVDLFLWQVTIPELAHQNAFLMHGLLAVAALHLAYLNPERQREYTIQATTHQEIAMPLFRSAIAHVNSDNCDAVLAFSHLLVIYSFATEKHDERLFLVEQSGSDLLPAWLYFIRNGCFLVCSEWSKIEAGPVQALVNAWETRVNVLDEHKTELVDYLLSIMPHPSSPDAWPTEICNIYRDAATELGWAFSCTRAIGERFSTWDVLRSWPLQISEAYMNLLQSEHPSALILLAYYCILLQKVQQLWYFEDGATRLLNSVMTRLDKKWHGHLNEDWHQNVRLIL